MDFGGSIRYDFPVGKWGVLSPQFEASYVGAMQGNSINTVEYDGYWTFNALLEYRDNHSGISVSIFVDNIADDVNITHSVYPDYADIGSDLAYMTPPRAYGVTVSYKF